MPPHAEERSETRRARAVAEGKCPEPGCPESLYLDPESPNIFRCPMHGPMAIKDGRFASVAEEIAAHRSMTLEEARAAVLGPRRGVEGEE